MTRRLFEAADLISTVTAQRRILFLLISIIVVRVSSGKSEIRKIHLGLVLAELVCLSAFIIEISRALGGNDLSWRTFLSGRSSGLCVVHVAKTSGERAF